MPDITMCASTDCPHRKNCYRNPEGGTKPSEWRQSWFCDAPNTEGVCDYFWPRFKDYSFTVAIGSIDDASQEYILK